MNGLNWNCVARAAWGKVIAEMPEKLAVVKELRHSVTGHMYKIGV